MNPRTVAVLGAGPGGISAAIELRQRLPVEHRVILIDRKRIFSECGSNLDIMMGEGKEAGSADLTVLSRKGIEFLPEEVTRIDPVAHRVEVNTRSIQADYLVVALGAELAPHEIPGFDEATYDFYDRKGAVRLQERLPLFESGRIAILISRTPFKCPAAPYEAAFLLDAYFRRNGRRDQVGIEIYTPEWQPMPVAGEQVGDAIRAMLETRGIGYHPDSIILKIDPKNRRLLFEVEEAPYDFLIGVPPHVAPTVVREAGLTDSTGWVPVNPGTLATRYPGTFALGDLAAIRLHHGMFLPMAAVFAVQEALVVATNIANEILGEPERVEHPGDGFCYIDVGEGLAVMGSGNFYRSPRPQITLTAPSAEYKAAKEAFANVLLESIRACGK